MPLSGLSRTARYATGFALGLVVFVAAPEGFRHLNGGALAQPAPPAAPSVPTSPLLPPPPVPGDGSIVTYGQSGGNNNVYNQTNVGTMPRRMPPAGISSLSRAMANSGAAGSVEVLTDLMACPDCDGFAKQFEVILKAAPGLIVVPVRNGMTMSGFKGVGLGVKDTNNPPPSATAIISAFHSVGANLSLVNDPPDGNYDSVLHVYQPNVP